MADNKRSDPTVTSDVRRAGGSYPEGTHPPRPLSEVTHSAQNKKYADNPDKPDPTTIAQIEVTDE